MARKQKVVVETTQQIGTVAKGGEVLKMQADRTEVESTTDGVEAASGASMAIVREAPKQGQVAGGPLARAQLMSDAKKPRTRDGS